MKFFRRSDGPDGNQGLKGSELSPLQLAERAGRLRDLAVLSLFLHTAGSREEVVAQFLERSPQVTGAVVTYPLLLDKRRDLLESSALNQVDDVGLEQASMAAGISLADLEFPLPLRSWRRSVMEGGEVVLASKLNDAIGDVIGKKACEEIQRSTHISKVAAVPLIMEGESFGLCLFLFSNAEPDVEVLELAAGHFTLTLKNQASGQSSTRLGGIDPVSWAQSRGYFLESLESEIVRSRRYGRSLSLVLFDVDDFADFNASYGRTLGDRVLRAVAMAIGASIAPPEVVARYGADEFVVLLPETNRAAAVSLTASIVGKLAGLSVFDSSSDKKAVVSASVAIVCYPEDGASRDELLAAAEMDLEQSKEERRAAKEAKPALTPVQQLRLASSRYTS